jgi:phosphatidylethanolamine-binding protein (PEBP) family uncharacterized protein
MTELEVYYNNKKIKNNEFITPIESQNKPIVKINSTLNNKIYTLIMYDPDAVNGTHVHWLIININDNNISNGKIILSYKGPAPPPKTGKHRYIFELYEQNRMIDVEEMRERNISINTIKGNLSISKYISKIQFISENINGGKKYKTNKRCSKYKSRKKRMTKRKK